MSLLFETIQILGGIPQNLSLHSDRLNRSRSELFGRTDRIELSELITVPPEFRTGKVRCRLNYAEDITGIEFSPYTPANVRSLLAVTADELDYIHKYSDRSPLSALISKELADDVMIIRNGCVSDASYANLAFYDGRQWFTPDTPLLWGTMRESLLRSGILQEARIRPEELGKFTHFRLINAMLGFEAPVHPVQNIIFPK